MRTPRDDNRSRTVLVLLVLGALSVLSVDAGAGSSSPVDPVRRVTASVLGPVQTGFATATRPVRALGDVFTSDDDLRDEVESLREDNDDLRSQLRTAGVDLRRDTDLKGIERITARAGLSSVNAHVVGVGGAQSFERTVTIDAGTSDGVGADMTVLNADGLVGRVVDATRDNATVLLIVDADSVVGGRLGSSMELGFLSGDGDLSDDAALTMAAIDPKAQLSTGDPVLTWGSPDGVPYVAGVPIGQVTDVQQSPRDQSTTAVVEPYADFSSLDVVSVVVGAAREGRRSTEDKTRAGGS